MLDLVVVITFTFSGYLKGFAIEGHFSAVTSSSITHHILLLCFLVCGKNLHFSISQLSLRNTLIGNSCVLCIMPTWPNNLSSTA